jgi:hypothetical protein
VWTPRGNAIGDFGVIWSEPVYVTRRSEFTSELRIKILLSYKGGIPIHLKHSKKCGADYRDDILNTNNSSYFVALTVRGVM